jgi:hypothetical protein
LTLYARLRKLAYSNAALTARYREGNKRLNVDRRIAFNLAPHDRSMTGCRITQS